MSGGSSSSRGSGGAVYVAGGSSSGDVGGEVTLSSGKPGSSAAGSRPFVRSGSGGNLATSRETSRTVGADVEYVAGSVGSTDAGTVLLTSGSGAVSACVLSVLVDRCVRWCFLARTRLRGVCGGRHLQADQEEYAPRDLQAARDQGERCDMVRNGAVRYRVVLET
ncbi:hypothetical protein PI124_g7072 [Phytophthora idaei]|nr:hypothetical protein PI125_g15121 [Phytophthora idaei]KAG3248232.1 hypothetical protein PI124_g7072 [Phytophthora idaei]